MTSPITRTQNAALTAGAFLGFLCLMAVMAGLLFGIKPLMFRSGSMEPAIATGGLALSIPVDANEVRVGDIVSTENSTGTRITHRVAAAVPADGYTELTLKGDANDVIDAEIYAVTTVDRVFWSAPLLGYAVAGLGSPAALFLGGLLSAYLLHLAFNRPRQRTGKDGSGFYVTAPISGRRALKKRLQHGRRKALRRATAMVLGGVLLLSNGALSGGTPAWAQFSDSATAGSNFAAGKLSTPEGSTCEVRWNVITLAYEIVLRWSYNGAVPTGGYEVSVNKGSWIYGTSASVTLPASDAGVEILARREAWRSQLLEVHVVYTPGTLTSSPTCAVQ